MKYDWIKLEHEFKNLKKYANMSLREFAAAKGIPYGGSFIKQTKGWAEEKVAKRLQIGCKIEEKITAKKINAAVEINDRHLQIYNKALGAIEHAIENDITYSMDMFGNIRNTGMVMHAKLKSLIQTLEIAQKGQRLALDMDIEKNTAAEEKLGSLLGAMAEAFKDESS